MDFLKNNKRISFKYDGIDFFELNPETKVTEKGNDLTVEYQLNDGLKVTNIARKIPEFDAYEWVTWFENTGDKPTKIISELYDCDVLVPMNYEKPHKRCAYLADFDEGTRVYAPTGSVWEMNEFCCDIELNEHNTFVNHIYPEYRSSKEYASTGGRSSDARAPFFNVYRKNQGFIFAIGWTGQWNARLTRNINDVHVQTKLEDTHFKLYPNEKIRTSSLVLMQYECDADESFNKWRKLIKKEFSLIGKPGRESVLPISSSEWGGTSTEDIIKWIDTIKREKLQYDCIWMDAAWYGKSVQECKDEFEGDWAEFLGDWEVNTLYHPDGLKEMSKAIKDAGLKFILWFEPECANANAPMVCKHPEYFLDSKTDEYWTTRKLLNLGNPAAWDYCFNMLSDKIESLNIDWYRQDFNARPLDYWRANDEPDRQGITEIKHIMGMYRLLDELLKKFPNLMIDNCASGGRRLDIEMFRRSVPLFRSDYQCPANFDIEATQIHNMNYNTWMPYSGTSCGRIWGDMYRARSCYAGGLVSNFGYTKDEIYDDNKEKFEWIRNLFSEYKRVQPYFYEDIYPLSDKMPDRRSWCATQYNRPSENDGMIEVFKRENSPYPTAVYKLKGLDSDKTYVFTDIDDNSTFEIAGKVLMEKGLSLTLEGSRIAKIYIYNEK